jgi:hypothetical protein
LALDHLKQMSDGEVEDVLGWSPDKRDQFLRRWTEMQRQAAADEDGARGRQFDDTLRSLGLRPRENRLERGASRTEPEGGLQDTSRSRPPAEYRELFDAFKRGTSRAGYGQSSE